MFILLTNSEEIANFYAICPSDTEQQFGNH